METHKMKSIRWTVDYPALYWEFLDSNLHCFGASITGLAYVLMGLENIYRIAKKNNDKEILNELKHVGIDETYLKAKRQRYSEKGKATK